MGDISRLKQINFLEEYIKQLESNGTTYSQLKIIKYLKSILADLKFGMDEREIKHEEN